MDMRGCLRFCLGCLTGAASGGGPSSSAGGPIRKEGGGGADGAVGADGDGGMTSKCEGGGGMTAGGRFESFAMDVTKLLPDVLLGEIIRLVGEGSFRNVAGTCRRFKKIYLQVFGTCTTSAEEMVSTVSGAKLFLRESKPDAIFRLGKGEYDICIDFDPRRKPLDFVRDTAALNGRLQVLQWVVGQGCLLEDRLMCVFAASSGSLPLLKWLRARGCPWDYYTCSQAGSKGHLDILQWAHANGCPWNDHTCASAARRGHLALLQWARANDCPWDVCTYALAAMNGHSAVLQWAVENGCPQVPL